MSELQLYQVVIAALIGLATAVAGWWYSRRIGVTAAEKALNETNKALIEALRSQLAHNERMCEERIADLSRRLDAAEQRWQRWAGRIG